MNSLNTFSGVLLYVYKFSNWIAHLQHYIEKSCSSEKGANDK